MKRQETNEFKGGKRLGVGKNAQTRAAGFSRLKETRTRTEAAAQPAVSFHSAQINPMSAGGDACWSREKTDRRKQHDAAGEAQLYTVSRSNASTEGDAARERAFRDMNARPLGPACRIWKLFVNGLRG